MAKHKASSGDRIPAEVWKYGGANLSNRLHRWITTIREEGHVPQAWKDASIVTIYKNETEQNVVITEVYIYYFCSRQNLFSDPTEHTLNPEVVTETQCGFSSSWSTVDMIFYLPQLQEKCIEHDPPLYIVFVNFTMAFDIFQLLRWWSL